MDYKHYDEDDQEIIWRVFYTPGWSTPVRLSGHPDNWHEAEGENLCVWSVTDQNGVDIMDKLSPEQLCEIEEACEKDVEE